MLASNAVSTFILHSGSGSKDCVLYAASFKADVSK